MGCRKKSTISQQGNLSKVMTHECHQTAPDQAPDEAKKSRKSLKIVEDEEI